MHAGEFSLDQANRYMIDFVPYMEEDLGRYDLEGYLRRPGSGSGYIIGMIPLTLMRWEMTGADDEVRPLWREATGRDLGPGPS